MANGAGDDLLDTLARNVRAVRLAGGLTIEELAERADLDVLTLDAIERGEGRRLTVLGLGKLARALDVLAGDLLQSHPLSSR